MSSEDFFDIPSEIIITGSILMTVTSCTALAFSFLLERKRKYVLAICFYIVTLLCCIYTFMLTYWVSRLIGYAPWLILNVVFGFAIPFGGSIIGAKITLINYNKDKENKRFIENIELDSKPENRLET